jgi:hypothetical protein
MRIQTSLHGLLAGIGARFSNGLQPMISKGGFMSGVHGNQFESPSPRRHVLFDDFLGDVLADQWNAVETDTDGAQAVLAGGIGGVLRITTGNDDGNDVVLPDLSGVTSYLNWQAANGDLVMQARVKISRITETYMFVGFTDLITIEAPAVASGTLDGVTTGADDVVGFVFDANFATSPTVWHLVGSAATVDATPQVVSGYAPVADDYQTLRIEVTAAGVATFFINGRQVGTAMTGAVTPAVDLTPAVYASNTDGTVAATMEVDYVFCAMNRAADGDNV